MDININIKIKNKEYPGNKRYGQTNKVYFTLNGDDLCLDIIYIEDLHINAFIDCPSLENVERYCKNHNIDFEMFKSIFQYMLYKYSRGVGLNEVKDPIKELRKEE